MLTTENLARSFGGVFAVDDVTTSVSPGELRGIIGPNGAGKSTLFNLIGGHLAPSHGRITYRGESLAGMAPHRRAREGIAIVFQGARLFRGMTALENVMVGAHAMTHHGFVSAALRLPGHRREERLIAERAEAALERVGLTDFTDVQAESLPLGQQRRLQVARALCGEPALLLLDEPASGLRQQERQSLAALLHELHEEGITMLLIEHDVGFVMNLADRITVLDLGKVIAEGTPVEVSRDPQVISAYLGRENSGQENSSQENSGQENSNAPSR
ncbi:ABC transporter ATP-binding protein [Streptomyces sp. NPDC096132]|uniref:ABC transporter ATP-binding protein n=1 Tax=Streptomyces sp. NPDC096132 TaxID=3366075 RepID=UPI0038070655